MVQLAQMADRARADLFARGAAMLRNNRIVVRVAAGLLVCAVLLLMLDWCFPLPVPGRDSPYALVVVARDGTPLRAFPGEDHVWRHPVALTEVSPLYRQALIAYEDKAFRWHAGVNPFALARAGWQWLVHGHIVSGGST